MVGSGHCKCPLNCMLVRIQLAPPFSRSSDEMVDMPDLESGAERRVGSSPTLTIKLMPTIPERYTFKLGQELTCIVS